MSLESLQDLLQADDFSEAGASTRGFSINHAECDRSTRRPGVKLGLKGVWSKRPHRARRRRGRASPWSSAHKHSSRRRFSTPALRRETGNFTRREFARVQCRENKHKVPSIFEIKPTSTAPADTIIHSKTAAFNRIQPTRGQGVPLSKTHRQESTVVNRLKIVQFEKVSPLFLGKLN